MIVYPIHPACDKPRAYEVWINRFGEVEDVTYEPLYGDCLCSLTPDDAAAMERAALAELAYAEPKPVEE